MGGLFEKLGDRAGILALSLLAWAVLVFLILPLFVVIAISFTTTEFLAFPPVGFTLRWYQRFLADPSYVDSILLSARLAFGSTLIGFLLGVPAALALKRSTMPGINFLASLFLSPLILPAIIIGVGVLQITTALDFPRSFAAMLAGHVVIILPYIVRTTLASLEGFDASLEEAARDLGASGLVTFLHVTLPTIKPGIIAGCLFGLIMSWIDVEVSIFNTVIATSPIPVKVFNYVQYSVDPMIAAVSAGTIYIAFIFVFLLDRLVGLEKVTGRK
ncbi:ABC transporter permease [Ancylobacter sp. MQZ15Z-1]|uniref:ABC transporter permease n=1 Tax=Ancylobacter mangrovi TaxID=2972472 RepID=A0A9X2PKM6_9HYPH|nr:ABC transporter permease [Ancylobacter mangrovi]MCS0495688.1 ABC transporter permease [Ancylobacter mangrovi]